MAQSEPQPPSAGIQIGQKQEIAPNPTQQPYGNRQGTEQAPIVVKILETPKTEAETTQDTKERNKKAAQAQRIVDYTGDLAFWTIILVAVATLQFFAFIVQAYWLRRTVTSAETTANRQLRAWVGFKNTKSAVIKGKTPKDVRLQFLFLSMCSGGSPAFNIEMYTQSKIEDPETGIPHFEMRKEREAPTGMMLPGGELGGDMITLSKGELLSIEYGIKNWYIHHVSIYRTLLEPDIEKITESCMRVTTTVSETTEPYTFHYNWVCQTVGPQNRAT